MTKGEAWLQHVSNLLVGGTGLVYGWMAYLAESDDPYAVVNHPLQPDVQHLHVLTAPLLVFACGMIWRRHVWLRVRAGHRPRRRTGLALFASLVPMAASGYLVQVSVSEGWRRAWVAVHVATSLLWIAAYLTHQLARRDASRGPAPAPAAAAGPDGAPPRADGTGGAGGAAVS